MGILSFLMWLGRGKAEEKLEKKKIVQADNKLLVEKLTLMCFHHGDFSRLLQAVRYQWLAEGSEVQVTQSHLTLCNPMDCSPSSSSVHGILQARILRWVAIPFSRVF